MQSAVKPLQAMRHRSVLSVVFLTLTVGLVQGDALAQDTVRIADAPLLEHGDVVLTDCNAGKLARAIPATKSSRVSYSEYQTEVSYLDGLGREVQKLSPIEDGVWARQTTQYGFHGEVVRERLPHRVASDQYFPASQSGVALESPTFRERAYDALGRVKGSWLSFESERYYDKQIFHHPGWRLSQFVQSEVPGSQVYYEDGFGNLIRVEEREGDVIKSTAEYRYDALGNRTHTYQGGVLLTQMRYDSRGLPELEADVDRSNCGDPMSCPRVFTYDAFGRLKTATDAAGISVVHETDELGRIYEQSYCPDGACTDVTVIREFDGEGGNLSNRGQLVRETKGSVQREWHYDHWGRVKWERLTVGSHQFRTDYTYDLLDRVLTVVYPTTCNGQRERAVYTYDALGLQKVDWESNCEAGSQPLVSDIEYDDPFRRQTRVEWASGGIEIGYKYDPRFVKLQTQELRNATKKLGRLTYDYYNDGKLRVSTDEPQDGSHLHEPDVWSYAYDYARRLTSAIALSPQGPEKYRFTYGYDDDTGNLTSIETVPGILYSHGPQRAIGLTYNAGSAGPHAATTLDWRRMSAHPATPYAIEYDVNGAAMRIGNGHVQYAYDADGRMVQVDVTACPTGWADCDGFAENGCEADLSQTCGNCAGACPTGMQCGGAACECKSGYVNCDANPDTGCQNLNTDSVNCGTCGHQCAPGEECVGGTCTCEEGRRDCDGDPANGCEVRIGIDCCEHPNTPWKPPACPANMTCTGSDCVCGAGAANCDGDPSNGCEDLDTDVNHCGSCSERCGPNSNCTGGQCVCPLTYGNCNGDWSDGCERDLTTASNCGACGNSCANDEAGKACVMKLRAAPFSWSCGCESDEDCSMGYECSQSECRLAR